MFQDSLGHIARPCLKKIKYWECSLVADYLPDMHEALSLILSSICVFVYIHMCVCEENIQHMFKI
jgi:hypothetical protein